MALSTGALGSARTDGEARTEALPDSALEPNPGLEGEWPSHRGGAGHARYADGPGFDGGALEAAWSVDHHDEIAVADGTVYATIDNGVVALEAADGSLVWENPDVAATAPSVDAERVFLTGTEVVALDRSNGRFRWRTDFGTDEAAAWQTVAYGGVYVVVNGALYALEPADGSVRWDVGSVIDGNGDERAFAEGTAAANGVVYAAAGNVLLAYDPDTGEEVWRRESDGTARGTAIQANETAVVSAGGPDGDRRRYDAQTGAVLGTATPDSSSEVALGETGLVAGAGDAYRGRSLEDDRIDWTLEAERAYGPAAVGGDAAYVAVADGDGQRRLVALGLEDGGERWSVAEREVPVGPIRALTADAIYVARDGDLVALREPADDGDGRDDDGRSDRTGGEDGSSDGDDTRSDPSEGGSERRIRNRNDDGGADDGSADATDDTDDDDESGDREEIGGNATDDGDGNDTADGGTGNEVDEETTDEIDGGSETEPGSRTDDDPLEDGAEGDGALDPEGTERNGATDSADGTERDAAVDAGAAERTPGFTAGAGIAGGALGLELLRRRAGAESDPALEE
ncbi:pyrrolo-quinoline quinone beta-propeller repeat protein [Natronococcus jeotgali DSM 18795]|uniref:Pyrrolo-quinoline quinone beta-propeller repeat protein n=1 Tax=Natronococcus jeotgali DSM 18795 TaxID=1227498 RepID=L9X3T0_9EURY|nr:pyrrolo-quinoline quinone beta-propeller repeat protein [Natronococcus jeotgali DSM 18795]